MLCRVEKPFNMERRKDGLLSWHGSHFWVYRTYCRISDWDNVAKPAFVTGDDNSDNLDVSEVQELEYDGAIRFNREFVGRFKWKNNRVSNYKNKNKSLCRRVFSTAEIVLKHAREYTESRPQRSKITPSTNQKDGLEVCESALNVDN